ncbi:hypothetical protein EIK77_000090 [Talaromyces pinophilus]|nr:hypothetical protein EIK77_000090 [Talaromyces pinophilus]
MEEPNQSQSESPRLHSDDGKENIETPSAASSQDKPDPQVERETLLKERDRLQSYKDEIETLALRITDTLIRLSEKLGEDELTSDGGGDTRICVPQLNYVQPGKMRKDRNVPERYSAIDVISENANSYQNRQDLGHDSKEGKPTAVGDNDEHTNLVENAPAIPDRVVLNSERLKLTIDHDLWDGTLSWHGDEAYHILQPFKILFYLNQAIRKRLEEYKTTIATRKPPEEDVDAEILQKDPRLAYRRRFVGDMDYTSLLSNINDLSCLVQFMDDHIEPVKARFQQHDPGPVRFTDLWFVFPPGTLVYVRDKNIPQKVWKVVQRTGGRRYLTRPDHIQKSDFHNTYTQFVLDCFYLDFDGVHYVPVYHQFKLNDFDGTQALGSLPVHPFRVSEIAKEKSRLLDQAHQFIECTKTSHRYYSGLTHSRTPDGAKLSEIPLAKPRSVSVYSEMVDSAVVVDFDRAFQEIPAWRPGSNDPELFQMSRDELDRDYYATDYDNLWDARFAEDLLEAERRKRSRWEKNGELPTDENDLLILPDRVFAYVLRTRKWGRLAFILLF